VWVQVQVALTWRLRLLRLLHEAPFMRREARHKEQHDAHADVAEDDAHLLAGERKKKGK